jgi:hypothetical protein
MRSIRKQSAAPIRHPIPSPEAANIPASFAPSPKGERSRTMVDLSQIIISAKIVDAQRAERWSYLSIKRIAGTAMNASQTKLRSSPLAPAASAWRRSGVWLSSMCGRTRGAPLQRPYGQGPRRDPPRRCLLPTSPRSPMR